MSERAPLRKIDGNVTFEGGVDTGKSPSLIAENQVQWAINTTFRGGYMSCRPGWTLRKSTDITARVQCSAVYTTDTGAYIIILAGGRVYLWDESTETVSDISIAGDLNPSFFQQGWMVQAENYLIIQDGFSKPLIFDGVTLRRAYPNEIKTGTVMAYVQGRIWYSLPSGYAFRATDIVYGDGTRSSVLKETENEFLNEGGDFSVPSDSGGITAIGVPGTLDTALGQGPLLVMTPKYIFAINAPVDRTVWKDVTYPIQSISAVNAGALGAKSTVTVNGDVFYRAADGIRSFIIARRDFNTWGNTPMSNEVSLIVANDQQDLLRFGSGVTFDNRLLMTTQPRFDFDQNYHAAMVVLDFDLLTGIRSKAAPAWEGIWTGLNIIQILKYEANGAEKAFILSKANVAEENADNPVEIWEVSRSEPFDMPGIGSPSPIEWEVWTRSYNFQEPFAAKELTGAEIWADNIQGSVTFSVHFKPDQSPEWIPWNSWTRCATVNLCASATSCISLTPNQPQYRTKMRLPKPSSAACDLTVGRQYTYMFESQLRLQVTGHGRVRGIRVNAQPKQENPNGECLVDELCTALSVCPVDQFTYAIANVTVNNPILTSEGVPVLTDGGIAIQVNSTNT